MNVSKKWNVKKQDEQLVKELSSKLGVKEITARLLINRGYKEADMAEAFINKSDSFLYNPFLMKDMDKAAERLLNAIIAGEHITIYGDYDVDGITSVSVLYMYLKENDAKVDYFIPSREYDGYGLGKSAIKSIAENGTSLIVTVDNGITAIAETEYAASLGLDIIITDHHRCPEILPNAYAIINPHREDCGYPFKELSGVGVAFKLVCAIELLSEGGNYDIGVIKRMCARYIDLVTIGTIADVMPLTDENRIMVYMGLGMLNSTNKIGIKALFEAVGIDNSTNKRKEITSSVIAYTVAPKLNAAGRMGDAGRAVKLILSSSKEEAESLAEEFCIINGERQKLETEIFTEAVSYIEQDGIEDEKVIVIYGNSWHHGVIGIAASRIAEKYSKPCVIISFDGCDAENPSEDDIGRGSARSIPGFNISEAFADSSDVLEKYGGHELAAGLSLKRKNLIPFIKRINEYAKKIFRSKKPEVVLDIDAKINISDVNVENIDDIMRLEPFGEANPQPIFCFNDVKIQDIVLLSMGKHTKIMISDGEKAVSALAFGSNLTLEGYGRGDTVDIAGNLSINNFRGEETPQIICRDIKLVEAYKDEIKEAEKYFQDIIAGDILIKVEDIPTHEDFAVIYKYLRKIFTSGGGTVHIKKISDGCGEPYIKILCAFRVFYEAALITYDRVPEYNYRIKLLPAEGKSDLSKTELMKKILYLNSETKF